MNDALIEMLLGQAPCPAVPAGLLEKLQSDIHLMPPPRRKTHTNSWPNPLRRWMPALAFSLFLLSCVVLIGVQGNQLLQLKRENRTLRAAAANLELLRSESERQRLQLAELERLQKDHQDLLRLRAEVAQLRDLASLMPRLRAENQQLLAATAAARATASEDQFFDEAQKRAERIACVNNLKQIGLSVRVWAQDNNDRNPSEFMEMTNELGTAKFLVCPSDKAKQAYGELPWSEVRPEMTSYQFLLSGKDETRFPESVISKCPIHHNYGYEDGSVQQIDPAKFREVTIDDRLYLKPSPTTMLLPTTNGLRSLDLTPGRNQPQVER